jgi:branched-chain amino acid transport system ATP-binding protein
MADAWGEPVLGVTNLTKSFGGLTALQGVDLRASAGKVLGLVGPNGSGKTTLINVVSGVHAPTEGRVTLAGRHVEGMPPHRLARLGLNRTFQIPRPFKDLTVADNVRIAARWRRPGSPIAELDPIEFLGLGAQAGRRARELTASRQKLLDLARALAATPRVLLVDELAAGLAPAELDHVASLIRELARLGVAIIVVEHLMGFLEAVTDEVIVLNAGRPIFTGSLRSAIRDQEVVRVFLGERKEPSA